MSTCPVCFTEHGSYILCNVNGYKIYKCHECGLEYTLPNPSNYDLSEFYSSYNDIRAEQEIVSFNAEKNIKLLERLGLNRNTSFVLDFGCGNGEFVEICGTKCYGVELKPNLSCDRIKNSIEELPVKKFNFITLWGVLEHLNNIHDVMIKLSSALEDGGMLIITTVDAEGLIPYYHKPPEHLTYWTKKSFDILTKKYGFEIVEYENYEMYQYSSVYLDRLLSRTPEEYKEAVLEAKLPRVIKIPTNEIFVACKKVINV